MSKAAEAATQAARGMPAGGGWDGAWRLPVEIAWGDCDDAGLVFYPHFFRWMDTTFHRWLRTLGISHRDIVKRFGVIGLPLVDAGAQFRSPVSYDDTLIIAVRVGDWQARRFRLLLCGHQSTARRKLLPRAAGAPK